MASSLSDFTSVKPLSEATIRNLVRGLYDQQQRLGECPPPQLGSPACTVSPSARPRRSKCFVSPFYLTHVTAVGSLPAVGKLAGANVQALVMNQAARPGSAGSPRVGDTVNLSDDFEVAWCQAMSKLVLARSTIEHTVGGDAKLHTLMASQNFKSG